MSAATRDLLLADLTAYRQAWPEDDEATYSRYRSFVETTPDCCQRTHLAGHCTGSALIVCPQGRQVLLLFHPFLQRWLQPGGHADGDHDLLAVACREAHEETGIPLSGLLPYPAARVPFDLDVHPIPARGHEPEHFHYDLRFLLLADPDQTLVPETADLRLEWIPCERVEERTREDSVLRMVRKLGPLARNPAGVLSRSVFGARLPMQTDLMQADQSGHDDGDVELTDHRLQ